MPSNHVFINNSIELIVVDSEMDDLLWWLMQNGSVVEMGIKEETNEMAEVTSYSRN